MSLERKALRSKPRIVMIQYTAMRIALFSLMILCIPTWSFAKDTAKPTEAVLFRDAKEYTDMIAKAGKLKIDDQIDAWQTFLSDHPSQTFRKEIEKNIDLLQSLSQKKSAKQGDEKDAELYLKAIEFSKKLTTEDQILLWQQFLDENPTNIYRNEVQTRLFKLKRSQPPSTKPATAPKSVAPQNKFRTYYDFWGNRRRLCD